MKSEERINQIRKNFLASSNLLNVLSCKINQEILIILLENCKNGGISVCDISLKLNMSRPAVSHHLKILKDNNIVSYETIKNRNYYHIEGYNEFMNMKLLIENIELYLKER